MNRRRQCRSVLLGACLLSILPMASVRATPLDPAGIVGQVLLSNPPAGFQVTTFGVHPIDGLGGSLQLTVLGTPAPFLSADATLIPFFFGRAIGTLVYQMEVLGPAGQVPVAITVAGGASGSSIPSSDDPFAGFALKSVWKFDTVAGAPVIPEEGITTPSLTGAFSEVFGGTHHLLLDANQVYKVTMTVDAGARAATASAFIDPIFSFGAGVGPEYTFSFSEGVGNVPEPASLALMGIGLAAIGLRRRVHRLWQPRAGAEPAGR